MNRQFLFCVLLNVFCVCLSALVGDNRYNTHTGNSINHRNLGPYSRPVNNYQRAPVYPAAPTPYNAPKNYAPNNHYNAPKHFSAPAPYAGHNNFASAPSHYAGNPKRSVYQPPQHPSYRQPSYPQNQQFSESKSQSHGREMKYTINDPSNRGTTHVTETHVVSNKQMHGPEAEAAMKKLMGSMGPSNYGGHSNDSGFQNFFKDMGLSFY